MASLWPAALDNFLTNRQNANPAAGTFQPVDANDINNLFDAVNNLEAALGLNPADVYANIVSRLAQIELLNPKTVTTTTYTLIVADRSRCISMANAAACTLTVPPNSSVAFPFGTTIYIRQGLAGIVTITGATGVAISSRGSAFRTAGQFAWATLVKTNATDNWDLFGDIQV